MLRTQAEEVDLTAIDGARFNVARSFTLLLRLQPAEQDAENRQAAKDAAAASKEKSKAKAAAAAAKAKSRSKVAAEEADEQSDHEMESEVQVALVSTVSDCSQFRYRC